MLICRVRFDENSSVLQKLESGKNDFLASLPHEHYSLADVFHGLRTSTEGLFATVMSIQNHTFAQMQEGPDLHFEMVDTTTPTEVSPMLCLKTKLNICSIKQQ